MDLNSTMNSESDFVNHTDKDLDWASNVTANVTSSFSKTPVPWPWLVYHSILFVWSILGIMGNSLTILVIWKYEHLRTSTNFLIASLATTDFVSSLLNPALSFLVEWFNFSSVWVPIVTIKEFIFYFTVSANVLNLTLVSVDRYIFIHHPLRYLDIMTKKRVKCSISFIWVYAGLVCGLFIAVASPEFIRLQTIRAVTIANVASPVFYNSVVVPHFLIVSSAILFLNVKIAVTAWKQSKRIQTDNVVQHIQTDKNVQQQNQVMMSNEMKITKMLVTVVGVFYATYTPSVTIGFFPTIDLDVQILLNPILLMNHWINPIIYILKNKELRRAKAQILNIK